MAVTIKKIIAWTILLLITGSILFYAGKWCFFSTGIIHQLVTTAIFAYIAYVLLVFLVGAIGIGLLWLFAIMLKWLVGATDEWSGGK
ncbi:hypothetical protein JW977_00880 [Candidatus Falkowbacteria bacterium]|nr:hypothetical protein [Candidatus Falkowbacteria bacterium]